MDLSFTPYCTDEDVAVRACGDFGILCPKFQLLASGTDGVFTAGSPWSITSASNTFANVAAGNVVILEGPRPNFTGDGEIFGVASVAAGVLTLKRIGLDPGVGTPPGPTSGGLTAVVFKVRTLQPQINSACLDLNMTFGIDPNIANKSPGLIYDPNLELNQAAVLTVLQRQYAMEVRSERGDFALKLRQIETDLAALKGRMTVKWGALGEGDMPKTFFGMRIRR